MNLTGKYFLWGETRDVLLITESDEDGLNFLCEYCDEPGQSCVMGIDEIKEVNLFDSREIANATKNDEEKEELRKAVSEAPKDKPEPKAKRPIWSRIFSR